MQVSNLILSKLNPLDQSLYAERRMPVLFTDLPGSHIDITLNDAPESNTDVYPTTHLNQILMFTQRLT